MKFPGAWRIPVLAFTAAGFPAVPRSRSLAAPATSRSRSLAVPTVPRSFAAATVLRVATIPHGLDRRLLLFLIQLAIAVLIKLLQDL